MKIINRSLIFVFAIVLVMAISTSVSAYTYTLSSGLFVLPANAVSVDWALINDSTQAQAFTVTVYQAGIGVQKVVTLGGLISDTVQSGYTYHNSNSVGYSGPFVPGFYYEVVVQTNSLSVLPTVSIWQDYSGTAIPGTSIVPGDFVRLQ